METRFGDYAPTDMRRFLINRSGVLSQLTKIGDESQLRASAKLGAGRRARGLDVPLSPTENVIRFGLFELDLKSGQLSKNGSRIRISQQPVQVLTLLLERPGEVVTREELRQRLWSPDTFVDFDHGLNKSVQKLRDALGDSAESPRFIETIPRVGYRFIAPVKVSVQPGIQEPEEQTGNHFAAEPVSGESAFISQTKSQTSPPTNSRIKRVWLLLAGCVAVLLIGAGWLAHRKQERERQMAPILSLAVLPLDNLSGDREQDYFADGMTDELTTMLAKDSTLRIVSRTSAMQYKKASRPLREIARAWEWMAWWRVQWSETATRFI